MIVMNQTKKGSRNGIEIRTFFKGQKYKESELGNLVEPWLKMGVCSAYPELERQIRRQIRPQESTIERSVIESVKRGRPKKVA